ncbi:MULTISPECIES: hypothetical protein [Bacteroides]|jgi:hypothetical protein|uniref:Uncharacterized protein n=1 Tax=Bacteroides stercoris ATCC 43183 TaxID=449673 RepID=B0NSM9_BACSE|nr:hypothetical protein [Bacteroides stercoris]MBP8727361.1 hypothetical protein [Bacteroides sp.]EDS14804.1 hypothetical protein BACSTE_02492 [Bacteroides stercoris ATCC 43183]MBS6656215.1 hypothetical protein [Bacteroides stercoris]MBV3469355.1 hypothetical protein [Bacteroides stercoris]MBV3491478.1 hypothetical protein [Bacteroides stercoris]
MVSFFFSVVFIQLQSYTIIIGIAEKVPVIVPRFDKNSCFTCNRLVFIRPARKKEPVRFILPLLCAIFAPDTNVMN